MENPSHSLEHRLEALQNLRLYLEKVGWPQSKALLQALVDATIPLINEEGAPRFTTAQIVERLRSGARKSEVRKFDQTKFLARQWDILEHQLSERQTGLEQFARERGLECFAIPSKERSEGGRGHSSLYFLDFKPIKARSLPGLSPARVSPLRVRYIEELTLSLSWWAQRIFGKTFLLKGWRRTVFVWLPAVPMLLVCIAWIFPSYSMALPAWSPRLIYSAFGSAFLISAIAFVVIRPWLRLVSWRLVPAPQLFVKAGTEDVQLELVDANDPLTASQIRGVRVVRYSSTCPICGGKISLCAGGREFPDRMVGRCSESPSEHVYSFDRQLRTGVFLRAHEFADYGHTN